MIRTLFLSLYVDSVYLGICVLVACLLAFCSELLYLEWILLLKSLNIVGGFVFAYALMNG